MINRMQNAVESGSITIGAMLFGIACVFAVEWSMSKLTGGDVWKSGMLKTAIVSSLVFGLPFYLLILFETDLFVISLVCQLLLILYFNYRKKRLDRTNLGKWWGRVAIIMLILFYFVAIARAYLLE